MKKTSQRGSIAILMVLFTITLITAVVVEINYRSQVSATIVVNRRDGEKAYQLARAAVRWSIFRLQLDNALDGIPVIAGTNYGGRKDDLSEVQWAVPLPYPFSAESLTKAEEGDEKAVTSKQAAAAEDIGGSFVSAISDETAKINLNSVFSASPPGQQPQWSGMAEVLENLLLLPRFQVFFKNKDHRELLWAIDDWTDADSEVNHLGGGIEDAEYRTDDNELQVKNAPFYTMEEIRMLKPMNPDLFHELAPFVTVYPFDARLPRFRQTFPTEYAKINVNTAPVEILAAILNRAAIPGPRERLECAQKLAKFRANVAFRSVVGMTPSFIEATQQVCGVAPAQQGGAGALSRAVQQYAVAVQSNIFSVEATGSVNQMEKTIHTVISRENVTQPKILYWRVL